MVRLVLRLDVTHGSDVDRKRYIYIPRSERLPRVILIVDTHFTDSHFIHFILSISTNSYVHEKLFDTVNAVRLTSLLVVREDGTFRLYCWLSCCHPHGPRNECTDMG